MLRPQAIIVVNDNDTYDDPADGDGDEIRDEEPEQ